LTFAAVSALHIANDSIMCGSILSIPESILPLVPVHKSILHSEEIDY
jgi:hypothetical protein